MNELNIEIVYLSIIVNFVKIEYLQRGKATNRLARSEIFFGGGGNQRLIPIIPIIQGKNETKNITVPPHMNI